MRCRRTTGCSFFSADLTWKTQTAKHVLVARISAQRFQPVDTSAIEVSELRTLLEGALQPAQRLIVVADAHVRDRQLVPRDIAVPLALGQLGDDLEGFVRVPGFSERMGKKRRGAAAFAG